VPRTGSSRIVLIVVILRHDLRATIVPDRNR